MGRLSVTSPPRSTPPTPRAMSRRRKPRNLDTVPQSMFDAVARRLDHLTECWVSKWPDGINPRSMLEKRHGHMIRAYRNGVRTWELYDTMLEAVEWMTVPGLCEDESDG